MKFDDLIKSISEMYNNPSIITEGLTLTYILPEKKHQQLHEEIFFKRFNHNEKLELTDEFELTIENIVLKFIKE